MKIFENILFVTLEDFQELKLVVHKIESIVLRKFRFSNKAFRTERE